MKPMLRSRLDDFVHREFDQGKESSRARVIGVHHRHGNGEVTDFLDGWGRANLDDAKVAKWIVRSVATIAADRFGEGANYRVYFASDSPKMAELVAALLPPTKVFVRATLGEAGGHPRDGSGWSIAGWKKVRKQAAHTTAAGAEGEEGAKAEEGAQGKREREEEQAQCLSETGESLLEMVALGLADVLVVTKTSEYPFLSKALAHSRGATYCEVHCPRAPRKHGPPADATEIGYRCVDGERSESTLATVPIAEVGYAPYGSIRSRGPRVC